MMENTTAVIVTAIVSCIIVICIVSWIADTHRFVVRRYVISSGRVSRDRRFVILADLHNKSYGPGNSKLIEAIDGAHPDAILIAGDMPNALKGHDFTPASSLIGELARRYPVYYGMGNHEYRLKIYPENYGDMWTRYTDKLAECGVRIMDNESVCFGDDGIDISALTIEKRFYKRFSGCRLTEDDVEGYLGGPADDPAGTPADTQASADAGIPDKAAPDCRKKGNFHILIAHNPEYFEAYSGWGADLTVSGHLHGGLMRLPVVGGVVSPRFRLFPRYSDGEYTLGDHRMIVSCGLGTHTIHVRIFNPGELSVIDIKKTE